MLDLDSTLAQVVADHPASAAVFQRHRMDFCCHGDRTIGQACRDRRVDPAALVAELERAIAERAPANAPDPATMSTPELIGHIVSTHHTPLRKALPFAIAMSAKVSRVHGERDPRLIELEGVVGTLEAELTPHLDQEERALFPALMAGTGDASGLAAMQEDHLAVGALLGRMRDLTDGFVAPVWACFSYRTLLSELASLEGDILRHVHLENHVLAPRFA